MNFYAFLAYVFTHAGLFFLVYTCIIQKCYWLALILACGLQSWNVWAYGRRLVSDYHGCHDCHFDGNNCTATHEQMMSKGGPGLGSKCPNWKQRTKEESL